MLDTSEVWLPSGNPHILDDDVFTGDSVTLSIMPGCTVLVSAGAELYTGHADPGSIVAAGKPDSAIVIGALFDTTPGSWRSVSFYENTMPTARLSYVTIEHAGGGGQEGAVYVVCSIAMDHCLVRDNATCGVHCTDPGCFSDFSNNTITTSGSYPVRIDAEYARTLGAGNILTGNAEDGVLIDGGNVRTTGTWLNHGVPYAIDDDVAVQDATNLPVLTLAAGTSLKLFPGTEFYIGYGAPGGLVADGAGGQITFTSAVTLPSPGDWSSLSFYANSIDGLCLLKNCRVAYGGGSNYGDIYIQDCTPTVTGCDIGYSSAYGVYLAGSEYPDPDMLRANNYIHDCVYGDINIPVGITEKTGSIRSANSAATVIRGVLFLPSAASPELQAASLMNAVGRKVLTLHPGANDVGRLAPGVYFVRDEGPGVGNVGRTRKVVITS